MSDAMYGRFPLSMLNDKVLVIFCLAFLVLCFVFCLKQWRMVRTYRHFPSSRFHVKFLLRAILGMYPKDVPFTNLIFQELLKVMNTFREEGLCVLWLHKPFIFIFSGKYVKDLVNVVELSNKGDGYRYNAQIFGNGLLTSKHEVWKVHRKLLNPAFSVGVLKGKMNTFNKYARQLADGLETLVENPGDGDKRLLKYCTFQIIADFALGLDLNNKNHLHMAENVMKTIELGAELFIEKSCLPWLQWNLLLPLFPSGRKYLRTVDRINQYLKKIINELILKKTESDSKNTNDDSQGLTSLGDILMKLYLEDHVFTEKDVRDQLVSFLSAGYDTVHATMSWCFYTLGHHPQVQEKAYSELQSVVPEGDITYEDLTKLKYLDCVIKETLRLYSTGALYERTASNDIRCGQYTIPKGSDVSVFLFVLHRDPNVFPEPEKFDPERFWDSSKVKSWMYTPFAEGYRNCIGKKFAMMEIKTQLVHVLRRFRIRSLNRIEDSDIKWTVTIKPTKPLRFSFENRI